MKKRLKRMACDLMVSAGCDRLARQFRREKVLIVMYHGITAHAYEEPVWTQLPVAVFRDQIRFLGSRYRPVTLSQFIESLKGKYTLPDRAVLITFDDGFKNNYTVALPVLQEFKVPAAVFLTTNFIGTKRFLWADELYLLVREACLQRHILPAPFADVMALPTRIWEVYVQVIGHLKSLPDTKRELAMERFRQEIRPESNDFHDDFSLLDWEEVQCMIETGLVEFGVHTASHKILSRLDPEEEEQEIVQAKTVLENRLCRKIESFCYPNGRSDHDFTARHKQILRQNGYACAFATDYGLYSMFDDPYAIRRVPAGNDLTSYPAFFRLACAGLV